MVSDKKQSIPFWETKSRASQTSSASLPPLTTVDELLEQPRLPSPPCSSRQNGKEKYVFIQLSVDIMAAEAVIPCLWLAVLTSPAAAKSRTMAVRLISMAMTGYYRTMTRPRPHRPLRMVTYAPVVKKKVLFLEATKGGRAK